MALTPIPLTTDGTGPDGAISVSISGPTGVVDPVVQALIAAGFGTAGQVLSTNAAADGFEWISPQTGL